MLLETLETFRDTEFWYVDQGICAPDCDGSASFRRPVHHRDEKWWLPVPRLAPGGLREATRTQLEHKRDCANQILKAAMAINSNALAEMDVPDSYHDSLPKNGRATLGDIIYRYITSEQFSPDCLLDCPGPVVRVPGRGDSQPRRGLHLRVAPEGHRRRQVGGHQIVVGHR
ncbi:hypothetical protein ACQ4PT_049983 [Festuca glaucescens]